MTEQDPRTAKVDEAVHNLKHNRNPERTHELKEKFWVAAVEWYNEELAGSVDLADGRKLEIEEI